MRGPQGPLTAYRGAHGCAEPQMNAEELRRVRFLQAITWKHLNKFRVHLFVLRHAATSGKSFRVCREIPHLR
jgi:hypothetical protein